jgi:hypothetical protein
MPVIRTQVPPNYVQQLTNTIEKDIGRIGSALANTVTTTADVAVNTVTGAAKVGVKMIGSIIDTWA